MRAHSAASGVGTDAGKKLVEIGFAKELQEGEMRKLHIGGGDELLICRVDGELHAVGNLCTHEPIPLSKGALFGDKIICPVHVAAFNVKTGALDAAPGLDNLPTFEIIQGEGDDQYFVEVPTEGLSFKVVPPMVKRDPSDTRNFVIVGAGAAGLTCAETLR